MTALLAGILRNPEVLPETVNCPKQAYVLECPRDTASHARVHRHDGNIGAVEDDATRRLARNNPQMRLTIVLLPGAVGTDEAEDLRPRATVKSTAIDRANAPEDAC